MGLMKKTFWQKIRNRRSKILFNLKYYKPHKLNNLSSMTFKTYTLANIFQSFSLKQYNTYQRKSADSLLQSQRKINWDESFSS